MSSEENYRKMKQKYLREQIINENFDQEEFAQYLAECKEDGTNIDNWEFDELINQVEDFKQLQKRTQNKQPQFNQDNVYENQFKDVENMREEFNTLTRGQENQEFDTEYVQNNQSGVDYDLLNLQQNQNYIKKDVLVLRQDQKKKDRFVFKLIPDNIQFQRKLSDLYWLRNQLQIEFPFYYIPPIKAVDNKDNFVQNFFNRLMDMKLVQDSETMKRFLNEESFSMIKKKEVSNVSNAMEKKISNSFKEQGKKQLFYQNEQVYDNLLTKILAKYPERKNNPKYFEALFNNLTLFCDKNSKVFSQLKHYCYDLMDLLNRSSTLVHNIATLFNTYINDQNTLFQKIGFKPDPKVETTQKQLKTGLFEWGSQLLSQKKFVNDNMASFYHYNKHEFINLQELLKAKLLISQKYNRKMEDINKKKLKLFQTRDVQKWGMPQEIFNQFDIQTVFDDFDKVKDHMLPNESLPYQEEGELNKFLDKHVLFEYLNFYIVSQFYIRENFLDFSNKMIQSYAKKDTLWNVFNDENVDVSYFDRESTITIKQFQYYNVRRTLCKYL